MIAFIFFNKQHGSNHMRQIVALHAVSTVTTKTVTELTEVVSLVVQTDFMRQSA